MLRECRQRRKLLRERLALAEQRRTDEEALLYDPIEDDPQVRPVLAQAEALAREELSGVPDEMGFCHLLWTTKQRILHERLGVTWFSPADMNVDADFT